MLQRLWRAIAKFFLWLAGDRLRSTAHDESDNDNKAIVVARPLEIEPLHTRLELHLPGFAIDETDRALALEKQGRERGALEQPPSDSTTLDPIEDGILNEARSLVRRAREEWEPVAEGEVSRSAQHVNLEIQNVLADARADEVALRAEGRAPDNDRGKAFEDARAAKQALQRFKLENGLDREARYARSRVNSAARAVFGMIVIEIILNAPVLSSGLPGGYSDGVLWAIAFASLNTVGGFFFGLIARGIFHRRLFWKLAGFLVLLLAVMWGAALNLAVAQFRDALAANPDNAFSLVMKMVQEHPFAITNFLSAILLVIGAAFYIGSFTAGLLFYDDPYPGYGRLDRRYKEAVIKFQSGTASALERLSASKEEKLWRVRGEIARVQGLIADHSQKASQADRMQARLRRFAEELESATNRLVQIYRDANRQARKTPAPAHFASSLRLEGDAANGMPQVRQEAFATERLSGCTDQIVNAFDEIQRNFPTLEEL